MTTNTRPATAGQPSALAVFLRELVTPSRNEIAAMAISATAMAVFAVLVLLFG